MAGVPVHEAVPMVSAAMQKHQDVVFSGSVSTSLGRRLYFHQGVRRAQVKTIEPESNGQGSALVVSYSRGRPNFQHELDEVRSILGSYMHLEVTTNLS